MSLAECEMTDCNSDTVTQMLKYNQAQNSPGTLAVCSERTRGKK